MAILVSLLVAFTLTPMMSSRLLKVGEKEKRAARARLHAPHRRILPEAVALVAGPPPGHPADLCRYFCFHLWPLSSRRTRLDSRRRSGRADSSFTLPEGTSLEKTTQTCARTWPARRGAARSCLRGSLLRMAPPITRIFSLAWCPAAKANVRTSKWPPRSAEFWAPIATSPTTCACLPCLAAKRTFPSPRSFAGRN